MLVMLHIEGSVGTVDLEVRKESVNATKGAVGENKRTEKKTTSWVVVIVIFAILRVFETFSVSLLTFHW